MAGNSNNIVERFNNWAKTYDKDFYEFESSKEVIFRIIDIVKSFAPETILDIGTGTGILIYELSKNINTKFIGIDISNKMLIKAKNNLKNIDVQLKIGSFLSIPLEDKSVDLVVSNLAMHHLTDEEKRVAIKEIKRVLKMDGKVVIGDIIFFEKFDWKNVTKENIEEKIIQAYGDEVRVKDLCCNIDRIIEMLNTEYPSYVYDLEKIFEDNDFNFQFERIKYWNGVIIASLEDK
jgi:putative AdoMet-dependent methyltransferase